MRVIAGDKGGRRLDAPPGQATRPTSDRVREAMFSMLESRAPVEGARVWDLFAGSGALGIEALSRGAVHVTFVDHSKPACSVVQANLAKLGYGQGRAQVICAEVLKWAHGLDGPAPAAPAAPDLVLADPPYSWASWDGLLAALAPLAPLVLVETGGPLVLPEGWEAVKVKRYGTTLVTLTRRSREA